MGGMAFTPRPDVEIGDHILTPYGVARVNDIDLQRNGLVTTHGSWGFEEIEAMPAPDTSDPDQVEKWLGLAARVVPKARVESVHAMCSCDCEHCYRTEQFRGGDRLGSYHYRNNEACRCSKPVKDPSSPGAWLPRCPCL